MRVPTRLLILAALALAVATPAQAQRVADLAPGFAPSTAQARAADPAAPGDSPLALPGERAGSLFPADPSLLPEADARPATILTHVAIGAATGAVLAVGVFYLANWDRCIERDDECGLAIPLLGAGGALVGALAGLVTGSIRNERDP